MTTTAISAHRAFNFANYRTYLFALAFTAGNLLLPQAFHAAGPQAGLVWLPIYFFTLIATALYGWRVGLLTAVASPLCNSLLFGMPAAAVVPAIIVKSVLLVASASLILGRCSERTAIRTFAAVVAVVLAYQIAGTAIEWAMTADLAIACQDLRLGLPGMLLQAVGATLLLIARR